MKKRIISIFVILVMLLSLLSFSTIVDASDDYPSKYKNAALDAVVDEWNFYNRECTSFAAWCLNSRNGVAFTNWYGGVRWGNAKNWGDAARSLGIAVDNTPAVGSVAWSANGQYGHVAYVTAVNGNNVTIEEYNYNYNGNYNSRTVAKSSFSGYIHIKDTTPSVSVSFSPWEYGSNTYIKEKDASFGQEINVSGGTATDTGMYLYDANGKFLAKGANGCYYQRVYFKINEELGYTLTPGTTYKYKFYAIVNGKTYWSKEYSFKTGGTAPTAVSTNVSGACGIEEGTYTLTPACATGLRLDINGASTSSGANVQIYSANDTAAQQFTIESVGKPYYRIVAKCSGMVLDVYDGSTNSEANVIQYGYHGGTNQKWIFVDSGGGYYYIRSAKNTNLSLDVSGAQNIDGANVQVYENNATGAQKWKLNKVVSNTILPTAEPEVKDTKNPVAKSDYDNHSYELYDYSMTWNDAKAYCESLGGHLVTITSENEEKIVEKLIANGSKYQYWIGLKGQKNNMGWVTGEGLAYSNWDKGQPDGCSRTDGKIEQYVQIFRKPNPKVNGSKQFGWNDAFYDNKYPNEESFFQTKYVGFICEYEPKAQTKNPPTEIYPYTAHSSYDEGSSVVINWEASKEATSYFINIYTWTDNYDNNSHIVSKGIGNTTTYKFTPSKTGFYRVFIEAINDVGASKPVSCDFSVVGNEDIEPEEENIQEENTETVEEEKPVIEDKAYSFRFPRTNVYHQDQFYDVKANQWFTQTVADAFEMGLVKGMSSTEFSPYGDVTVAEAITMAARIHKIYTSGTEDFASNGGMWYQVYLDYAYENSVISRAYYNSDVSQKATRAQFAEIFANAMDDIGLYPISTVADNAIPDVKMTATYANDVYKLYRAGILAGNDTLGTFSPNTYITRAEASAILARMADTNNRLTFTIR